MHSNNPFPYGEAASASVTMAGFRLSWQQTASYDGASEEARLHKVDAPFFSITRQSSEASCVRNAS